MRCETPRSASWGKRRNTDATDAATQIVAQNDRGYTGHEMLDNIGARAGKRLRARGRNACVANPPLTST